MVAGRLALSPRQGDESCSDCIEREVTYTTLRLRFPSFKNSVEMKGGIGSLK